MAEGLAMMHNTGMYSPQTKSAMRGLNPENFNPIINGRLMRAPLRKVYIHSVARRPFDVKHMLLPNLKLRGCEGGERSVLCTSLPDPIPQPCPDLERGGTRLDDNDAWLVVMDMLVPGNFTMDPYAGAGNPNFFANRDGTNLIAEGVFPSLNEVATEAELLKAENARERHDRYLTGEAQKRAVKSTKALNEWLESYPDTHSAMDRLGISATWHTLSIIRVSCPNCGDEIKQGIPFHKSSVTDRICVIDAMKSYKAKAITRDEYEELTGEKLPGRRASAE